jgi:hypothetical protein
MASRTKREKQVIATVAFAAIWFAMDLVQFIDWGIQHFRPSPVVCQPQSTASPIGGR